MKTIRELLADLSETQAKYTTIHAEWKQGMVNRGALRPEQINRQYEYVCCALRERRRLLLEEVASRVEEFATIIK